MPLMHHPPAYALDTSALHNASLAMAERAHFEIGDDVAVEPAGHVAGQDGRVAWFSAGYADQSPASNGPDPKSRIAVVRAKPPVDGKALAN